MDGFSKSLVGMAVAVLATLFLLAGCGSSDDPVVGPAAEAPAAPPREPLPPATLFVASSAREGVPGSTVEIDVTPAVSPDQLKVFIADVELPVLPLPDGRMVAVVPHVDSQHTVLRVRSNAGDRSNHLAFRVLPPAPLTMPEGMVADGVVAGIDGLVTSFEAESLQGRIAAGDFTPEQAEAWASTCDATHTMLGVVREQVAMLAPAERRMLDELIVGSGLDDVFQNTTLPAQARQFSLRDPRFEDFETRYKADYASFFLNAADLGIDVARIGAYALAATGYGAPVSATFLAILEGLQTAIGFIDTAIDGFFPSDLLRLEARGPLGTRSIELEVGESVPVAFLGTFEAQDGAGAVVSLTIEALLDDRIEKLVEWFGISSELADEVIETLLGWLLSAGLDQLGFTELLGLESPTVTGVDVPIEHYDRSLSAFLPPSVVVDEAIELLEEFGLLTELRRSIVDNENVARFDSGTQLITGLAPGTTRLTYTGYRFGSPPGWWALFPLDWPIWLDEETPLPLEDFTITVVPAEVPPPAMPEPEPPEAPALLTAISGDGSAALSWEGVPDAISYSIYLHTFPGFALHAALDETSTTATQRVITGLQNGTRYYFKVTAWNAAGESLPSNVASTTPQASLTRPQAPQLAQTMPGDERVGLSWSAVSSATSYRVYVSRNSSMTPLEGTFGTSQTQFTVMGLTNGTRYHFAVTAMNAAGESDYSQIRSGTPVAPPPQLVAPTLLQADAGDGQVDLAWSTVSSATSYAIYTGLTSGVGPGSHLSRRTTTATQMTVPGLTNGQTYFFSVAAVSGSGESPTSNVLTAMPMSSVVRPDPPQVAPVVEGDGQISLQWTPSMDATEYRVYVGLSAGVAPASAWRMESTTSTQHTVSALSNGTTYFFKVTAWNVAGESDLSNEVSGTPMAAISIPMAPTLAPLNPGDEQVDASWSAVGAASEYCIYWDISPGVGPMSYLGMQTTTQTTEVVDMLTNGTTYYFVVTAWNVAGESTPSNEQSAAPMGPPPMIEVSVPPASTDRNAIYVLWDTNVQAYVETYGPVQITVPAGWTQPIIIDGFVKNATTVGSSRERRMEKSTFWALGWTHRLTESIGVLCPQGQEPWSFDAPGAGNYTLSFTYRTYTPPCASPGPELSSNNKQCDLVITQQ